MARDLDAGVEGIRGTVERVRPRFEGLAEAFRNLAPKPFGTTTTSCLSRSQIPGPTWGWYPRLGRERRWGLHNANTSFSRVPVSPPRIQMLLSRSAIHGIA